MTQKKRSKKKDWIVQVMADLKELKFAEDLEKIKIMKKVELKNILDNRITEQAFQDLESIKGTHSKVMNLKHKKLEMQKYLKACNIKIKQEEAQEIFRLRSRVSNVKTNFKSNYDTLECEACYDEDEESQKHVLQCKILNEKHENVLEYEEIFDGNVKLKVEIAKRFLRNIRKREKLKMNK